MGSDGDGGVAGVAAYFGVRRGMCLGGIVLGSCSGVVCYGGEF